MENKQITIDRLRDVLGMKQKEINRLKTELDRQEYCYHNLKRRYDKHESDLIFVFFFAMIGTAGLVLILIK